MTSKSKSQDKSKMSEIDGQITKHFEIKRRLGKGAYGIVWKAIDKDTRRTLAVKKIFDAFRNETDAQRTFREITFLRAFRNHPNVIQLHNVYKASNNLDIYLSFEYMESDLHNVIKKGTVLKDIHKRYVMYQLFNAIRYIHSGNVIHRDLKPSNVLIDSKCKCKIADFGLARSLSNQPLKDSNTSMDSTIPLLTDYVATRWYRAPEILVANKRYTKGIDMWSLGCILGEMIRGKPLFPGSSTVNQIEKIVTSLPGATENDIVAVGAGFGSVLLNQQKNPDVENPTIDELLHGATDDGKYLVKSLLVLDPSKRLTAKVALNHRYVERFKNSIEETELNADVLPSFRDDIQLSVIEYRTKLYEIVQSAEKAKKYYYSEKPNFKITDRELKTNRIDSTTIRTPQHLPNKMIEASNCGKQSNILKPQRKSMISVNQSTSSILKKSSTSLLSVPSTTNSTLTNSKTSLNNTTSKNTISISNPRSNNKLFSSLTEKSRFHRYSTGNSSIPTSNNSEKRHSLDSSYSIHKIPNFINQSNSLSSIGEQKLRQHGLSNYSNHTIGTCNKSSNRLNFDKNHNTRQIIKTKNETESDSHTSIMPQISGDINSRNHKLCKLDTLDNSNTSTKYYEKRLQALENKIQKHKMELKQFYCENPKCKTINTLTISANDKFKNTMDSVSSKQECKVRSLKSDYIKYDSSFAGGDILNETKNSKSSKLHNNFDHDLRKSTQIV